MIYPMANDYLLFNPDPYDETTKQQHSNFLMTPLIYCIVFQTYSHGPFTDTYISCYSSAQFAVKQSYRCPYSRQSPVL